MMRGGAKHAYRYEPKQWTYVDGDHRKIHEARFLALRFLALITPRAVVGDPFIGGFDRRRETLICSADLAVHNCGDTLCDMPGPPP